MLSKKHELTNVSVVLCSYNGEAFIKEQITTVLNQTYPLYELIIVDDCSTDRTIDIIEDFAKSNGFIKFYRNKYNLGYNKCFEKAVQLASGDVIAISDQDDVWHQQKIEILMQEWKDNSLLIYSDSIRFENKIPNAPKTKQIIRKIEGRDSRKLSIYNTVSGHAMMIRKELLSLALPFDKNGYYDWWLAAVAMANGGITYVPSILVYQRSHNNNASTVKGLGKSENFASYKKLVVSNLLKFQSICNLEEAYIHFFKKFYYLWSQSLHKKYNWQLFLFLLKNRKIVYYYKNRKFGFISHLKSSMRYSFQRIKCSGHQLES